MKMIALFMKTKNRGFLVSTLAFALAAGCAQVAVPQPPPPPAPSAGVPGAPAQVEAQSTVSVPGNLSPAVSEVIRLAESGTGDDVILAYIQNSQGPFNLSAD